MKSLKLVTFLLSGFLFVQLQAQDTNNSVETTTEKKVIIIKKTIDDEGNETTETIVKEGDDTDNIFFLNEDGETMEIDIEAIKNMDGETIDWKSKDGKSMKVIKHSQTIEVDDGGDHKSIKIVMADDGEADVYQWDGEGDIPADIKKELQAKGIELEGTGDKITIAYPQNGKAATTTTILKSTSETQEVILEGEGNKNVEVRIIENGDGTITKTTTTIIKNGEKTVTEKEEITKEQ